MTTLDIAVTEEPDIVSAIVDDGGLSARRRRLSNAMKAMRLGQKEQQKAEEPTLTMSLIEVGGMEEPDTAAFVVAVEALPEVLPPPPEVPPLAGPEPGDLPEEIMALLEVEPEEPVDVLSALREYLRQERPRRRRTYAAR